MPFLEHLEELRWRIIRSLVAIFVFAIIAFLSKEFVFHTIILGPSRPDFWTYRMLCKLGECVNAPALCIEHLPFTLQSRQMTGQFTMHLTSSLVLGLIGAFPYAFWELWQFIKPGLYARERSAVHGTTFVVSCLFLLGVLFGYYIIVPLAINFLASYQLDPRILNEFDIISYVSTLATLVLACAFMFQLPMAVYFLAKVGIAKPSLMRTYRRHAIIVIFTLSAIITPPDVMSQLLIAIPLVLLYEFSIFIAQFVINREKRI
ncbi:MAG: twin-arginine translocase subunit TatC [Cytophagales bacterium]|nr:twin-arginine translocase subunit TatC [Cytophagales bacterium]